MSGDRLFPASEPELLVKSSHRVRELGEVFTPAQVVDDMLDLLPPGVWSPVRSQTFLEPACGNGNFLVAVLNRKLDHVIDYWRVNSAGVETLQYLALKALASIYGMDLSPDNVLGGTMAHPIGARERLHGAFARRIEAAAQGPASGIDASARWILEQNLQVADMLPNTIEAVGQSDSIPLIVYDWDDATERVTISRTSLDNVLAANDNSMTLFGPPPPDLIWAGPASSLHEAPSMANQPVLL